MIGVKIAQCDRIKRDLEILIGNPRKTWQTFNELTSRRVNNTTVKELKLNDTIISNSSELSNAFNDHFFNNWAKTC